MSARLLSLKPSLYASFIAVSTSLVRLSVCVFPIFLLSELTNYTIRPIGGLVNSPTQRFFFAAFRCLLASKWADGHILVQSKGVTTMRRLTDKNILITGGNSGIGLAAAQEF